MISGFCSDKYVIKMPNSEFCLVAKTSNSNLTSCISILFLVGWEWYKMKYWKDGEQLYVCCSCKVVKVMEREGIFFNYFTVYSIFLLLQEPISCLQVISEKHAGFWLLGVFFACEGDVVCLRLGWGVVMKKICPRRFKTETSGQGCIEGKCRLCHAIFLLPYLFWSLSLIKEEGK